MSVCSSLGGCKQGSGQCECFAGYTGNACNECAVGFTRTLAGARGPCIYLSGSKASCGDGSRNGNELGVDCGGPNCPPCERKAVILTTSVIGIVAAVSACCALLALVGIGACCRRYFREHAFGGRKFTASVVPQTPGGSVVRRNTRIVKVNVVAPFPGPRPQPVPQQRSESVMPESVNNVSHLVMRWQHSVPDWESNKSVRPASPVQRRGFF